MFIENNEEEEEDTDSICVNRFVNTCREIEDESECDASENCLYHAPWSDCECDNYFTSETFLTHRLSWNVTRTGTGFCENSELNIFRYPCKEDATFEALVEVMYQDCLNSSSCTCEVIQMSDLELSGKLNNSVTTCNSIREIHINQNSLTGTIPSFETISNLTRLEMEYNDLTGSVPVFETLTALLALNVANNNLNGTLPATFFQAKPDLEIVRLNDNDLSGYLPSLICEEGWSPQLDTLNLWSNEKIGGVIPDSLGNCSNLKYIDLSFTNLEGEIPSTIFELPRLETLRMLYMPHLLGPLPNVIDTHASLIKLKNSYSVSGNVPVFRSCPNLEEFNCEECSLSGTLSGALFFFIISHLRQFVQLLHRFSNNRSEF